MNDTDSSFPLAPEQRALARLPDAGAPRVLRIDIDGPADPAALRRALDRVLDAHEVLRHDLRGVPGWRGLRQVVLATRPPVDWREIAVESEAAAGDAWTAWLTVDSSGDAAPACRVRALCLRHGAQRATLGLAFDARLVDAGSLATLFGQLADAVGHDRGPTTESFAYRQFVAWREDLAAGDDSDDVDAAVAHWALLRRGVEGLAAPRLGLARRLDLPTARRHRHAETLDAALRDRVRAFAARRELDPRAVLQAAWWLLVARHDGGRPAVVGWQHDCREDYAPMRGAVGVYDKVLPWLIAVDADTSAGDWITRFAERIRGHVDAQEFWPADEPPFETHLHVGYAELPVAAARQVAGATWHWRDRPAPQTGFELALQMAWDETTPSFALHADGARYGEEALRVLAGQYRTLLAAALADPQASALALPLGGPDTAGWRGPTLPPGGAMLGWHVARWAELSPRQIAVESRAGSHAEVLDYAALETAVRRLAARFVAAGVGAGDRVALALPRSAGLVVAMLAAWRTGAAYLPLDPDWPPARRDAIVADARPRLVLDEAALHALPDADADTGDGRALAAPRGRREDIAYVLYTSGSTGRPKGVAVTHGALLNYVVGVSDALGLAACRRWGLTSAVAADLGNTALFGALHHGAALVVAEPAQTRSPDAFARFVRESGIDAIKIVPSHLEALLDAAEPALPATIVLGGEPAPRALVRRLRALAPHGRLFNHYGPTEATVGVMVHAVTPEDDDEVLPLTRVLANNNVRVLDAERRPTACGQIGELFIGGAQLSPGYLGDANADAFVTIAGERLYHTGDLAMPLPGGGLRLAGRADHQVKIRGHRVEPAEVEAALLAQPGVRQAVVLAPVDGQGAHELVALVVLAPPAVEAVEATEATEATLRAGLAQALPAHLRPARYVTLDAFPRLVNGKIDRLTLAQRLAERHPPATARAAGRAPADALEAWLAETLAAVLGRAGVDADEDFFELGGHSLLAIKLVARLRKRLSLELAPAIVFDHPSPAALAQALRALGVDESAFETPASGASDPAHRTSALAD